MIFYILLWAGVAISALTLVLFPFFYIEEYSWRYDRKAVRIIKAVASGIGSSVLVAIVWFSISSLVVFIGWNATAEAKTLESRTYNLQALGNDATIEGQFHSSIFVGVGYVEGTQMISYIQETEDYSELKTARNDQSRIYQDTDEATVTEWWGVKENEAWAPWSGQTWIYQYDFHVPEGSVIQSYEIGVN